MLRASASSIKFTPLYPTQHDLPPSSAPFSHLLEIDGVRMLLDCGWNDMFDPSYLDYLLPYLAQVDGVLISTPEMISCGALPFVLEHIRPGTPVVAAASTSKMGLHGVLHPFLYQFSNTSTFMLQNGGTFTMTADRIYSAFRSLTEPYGGKVTIRNKDVEIECTSIFAGRMLGGHAWAIKYQIDELLYCPDCSLKPSYALKRFSVTTPSNILFLQAFPMHLSGSSSSKQYEEQLQSLFRDIQHTLRSGSDVLIPVNVVGRGLEIVTIISHLLAEKGGDKYKVVLAAIQAQEVMDKAATMTEALQDDVILSDRSLFSNVIACKTVEDVVQINGPKVCIADGATLDFGIAAELLEHFLPTNSRGGCNLIVFPEPPYAGTTAYAIAEAADDSELTYTYVRRSRLNKEELEEYYLEMEHEMEAQRRKLEEAAVYAVEAEVDEDDNGEADDDDDTPPQSNTIVQEPKAVEKKKQNTPGLVLPPYMHFHSKYLHFPVLEAHTTLNGALQRGDNIPYGIPVSDEEQQLLRQRAPARNFSDEGPESLQIRNDAQMEANLPSKVSTVTRYCQRHCRIIHSDLSGFPDAVTLKTLLKSRYTFAKKIVPIRGSMEDGRLLLQFCRAEKSIRCGENVLIPQGCGVPLELATQVFSYVVHLDSGLAHTFPTVLRQVRETNSKGLWEVGWINGELCPLYHGATSSDEPRSKKQRVDTNTVLTLAPVSGHKSEACAEEREKRGLQQGSYFVGDMELNRLRDNTRRETGLHSEFHKKAPMLVFDEGVCVRKGANGTVTLASIATPSMYDVRRMVYQQYAQYL